MVSNHIFAALLHTQMKTVESFDFSGKRALIRVDFNVPLDDSLNVSDDTRIRAALPTINKILSDGGSVVLMSHLGRPKGGPEEKFSLNNLSQTISSLLSRPVKFAKDCISKEAQTMSSELKPGEVLLLENLRFYEEEKKGDASFAEALSKHGDVYVNDAFGTAHRAHASTAIVAQYFQTKLFGKLLAAEIQNAQKVLDSSQHPFTAIIGGAKVSSKIEVITNLLDKIDNLIIGGGMAYTFIRAQGGEIGNSLVELDFLDTANKTLSQARDKSVAVYLPVDSVVANKFDNNAERKIIQSDQITSGWMGLDIGPKAIKEYGEVIQSSKTILWNGPAGVFELSNFAQGTKSLGLSIAQATSKGAYSLVGGGDSVAAAKQFGVADKMSFISTGGGAMLEFLEGKTLPGVAVLSA